MGEIVVYALVGLVSLPMLMLVAAGMADGVKWLWDRLGI